jgi:DNA-binding transcriptional LysR family regulator
MNRDKLQAFLTLAQELNFTRAAEKLRMSQPRLSRYISDLESTLKVKLISRTTRVVTLTRAGEVFVSEARKLLAIEETAITVAKRAAAGEIGTIRLGFVTGVVGSESLGRVLRAFNREYPGITIQLEESPTDRLIERLRGGHLDIAFHSAGIDASPMSTRVVDTYGYVAAVPSNWPLAHRKNLKLKDLASSPLILGSHAPERGMIIDACRNAGFEPNVVHEALRAVSIIGLVAHGFGAAFLPSIVAETHMPKVTALQVTDLPKALVWSTAVTWVPQALPRPIEALIESFRAGSVARRRRNTVG